MPRDPVQCETDLSALRRRITELVARNAVAMVQQAIDAVKEEGQYQAIKYLFEMIGLYPPVSGEADETQSSLAQTLLDALSRRIGMSQQQRFAQQRNAALLWRSRILAISPAWVRGAEDRGEISSRMDLTWITSRVALGGGIWNSEHMADVARAGITHIIDMQIEFDDTPLAEPFGIQVLWNPTDDDFQPKEPELFQRGVDFAMQALEDQNAKVFIHCAAGVHRAAMMTLAILCSQGWELDKAMETISSRRPVVDFAEVYVNSVEKFLQQQVRAGD